MNSALRPRHPWPVVLVFALAMAWVESAVVLYLRTMIHRIEPYQPHPLPISGGAFGRAEIVREAATLIMLATVGWLAGRTWRSRIGHALLAFGVWDIAYYVWLIPLTGWPHSPADWDVLFLIPLPWWGPVWAPVSIATLMIVFGYTVAREDAGEPPRWPRAGSLLLAAGGALLALHTFMADALAVVSAPGQGLEALRDLLPVRFRWPEFLVALGLMAVPVVEVLLPPRPPRRPLTPRHPAAAAAAAPLNSIALHPMNHARWILHFENNRRHRPEPDWNAPRVLAGPALAAVRRSVEQFQLGDGGGPACLIARDAARFCHQSPEQRRVVDLWFAEEREHARLLGCAVDRLGGRRLTSHWSFHAFCASRRWLGVAFELQVLLLTEIVSTAYYRQLRRHCPDPVLRAACALILRDEAGHVAFHGDRLAAAGRWPRGFWRLQFIVAGFAAATMLWVNHRPALRALGGSTREFYREVRRELGRFLGRLARNAHAPQPPARTGSIVPGPTRPALRLHAASVQAVAQAALDQFASAGNPAGRRPPMIAPGS